MQRKTVWLVVGGAALAALLAASGAAAVRLRRLETAAKAGARNLDMGARQLAAHEVTRAIGSFRTAGEYFQQAEGELAPPFLEAFVVRLPWAGRQYRAAGALIQIGRSLARAGEEASLGLAELLAAADLAEAGRLARGVGRAKGRFAKARAAVSEAARIDGTVREEGLTGPLREGFRGARRALSRARPAVQRAGQLLDLAGYFLQDDRRLLVVAQNGAELRATGGFIGSYGLLIVGPRGIRVIRYEDVSRLPHVPVKVRTPQKWVTRYRNLRHFNHWIDFPTSARKMLGYWRQVGQPRVDGVVAIDTEAVVELLKVTGPVAVPRYGRPFSAEDLLTRLTRLIEVESGGPGAEKKEVLGLLAKAVLNGLEKRSGGDLVAAGGALVRAADCKHVQIYLKDRAAQGALDELAWAGRVHQPRDATDLLVVVNSMTRASKVNIAVRKSIRYTIALGPDGSGEATIALSYANRAPFPFPLSGLFAGYVRVHRGRETTGMAQVSALSRGSLPSSELGLPTHAITFEVPRGERRAVVVTDTVTDAWHETSSRAGVYRLYLFKQPDLTAPAVTVSVTAPPGWRVRRGAARGLQPFSPGPLQVSGRWARYEGPLEADLVLELTLEGR